MDFHWLEALDAALGLVGLDVMKDDGVPRPKCEECEGWKH